MQILKSEDVPLRWGSFMRKIWPWMLAFALVALGIIAGSLRYYRSQETRIRQHAYDDLTTISALKSADIEGWLQERLGDATIIAKDPFLADALQAWQLDPGNKEIPDKLRIRLGTLRVYYGYQDIILASPEGDPLLMLRHKGETVGQTTRAWLDKAAESGGPVFSDFYFCEIDQELHLDVLAPIYAADGSQVGTAILRIDPRVYLYPLLQSWPVESASAETLLVKRDGSDVLFLNELRHRSGTALSMRLPLTNLGLPAAQAVLGQQGISIGVDYRGVPVLAVLSRVRGTEWYLVTKVDQAEILAPLHAEARSVAWFSALLVLLAGGIVATIVTASQSVLYRRLFQSERQRHRAEDELRLVAETQALFIKARSPQEVFEHVSGQVHKLLGDGAVLALQVDEDARIGRLAGTAGLAVSLKKLGRWLRGKSFEEYFILHDLADVELDQFRSRGMLRLEGGIFQMSGGRFPKALCETIEKHEHMKALYSVGFQDQDRVLGGLVIISPGSTPEQRSAIETLSSQAAIALARLQTEEAMRKSEEHLRTTLYSIGEAVITTDTQGIVTRMNPVAESLTAWLEEEAVGQPLEKVFPIINAESRQPIPNPVEKVLQQGEVVGLANHTILVNRIGHEYPIIDNGTPIHDVEGQVSGVVLVFRDQTEERAAQLRLRESEARFRAIFEDAALGIFQASPDGTYRLMNRTFARMYGYDSPEEMTAAITSIQHDLYIRPEERERWTLQLDEVDALQGIEVENRRRDGSSVWVSLNVRAVRGQQGELLYYEGSIEDITQRKHALAALAEQHASLNALLESSSSPIFSLDREYRYLNFNQAHAAVMKALYGAEIMHGHSIKEYMSIAEDWKTAQVNIDRALQGENVLEQAFSGEPGRERRYFEVNHHPVRSLDGEVFGVSVFARDLTEHLQAEERQRWLTGILERSLNEIYAFDPQTLRFSFANQGALKNLGYSLEEITVLTPLDIKPLIDSEEFEVLAAPLRTGQQESVLFETLHQRKDGSRYEALILLQLLPSETGQQFLAIGLDVSESRQAEQKLLESEERYRQLFESMAEGVVMHEIVNDAAGAPVDYRILDCNPAFTRHTGLEPAMLLGKLASEAYGAGEAPYLETYARVVRSGRVERFETFFEPLGRHFEISASPWGENGFVTLFSDISERRQQEDKLKTQMSELRRWYEATLGREQRVIELKREVNEILTTSGQPSRYKSTGSDASPDSG